MPNLRTQIQQVSDSYSRCCKDEAFFEDFYRSFLSQSDEISAMFEQTDWYRQRYLLKSALKSAILFAKEPSVHLVKVLMANIASSHSIDHYNIRPDLYPIWLECMIQTVSKHDPKYSHALGEAWKDVLKPTIEFMISQYNKEDK